MTWGEVITQRCFQSKPTQMDLSAGTYLVTVPADCTVTGTNFTLSGIIRRIGRVTIQQRLVTDLRPIGVQELIPASVVAQKLADLKFKNIAPVAHLQLEPLKFNDGKIDWNKSKHGLTVAVSSILSIAVVVLIICIIWRCYSRCITCCNRRGQLKVHDVELETLSHRRFEIPMEVDRNDGDLPAPPSPILQQATNSTASGHRKRPKHGGQYSFKEHETRDEEELEEYPTNFKKPRHYV